MVTKNFIQKLPDLLWKQNDKPNNKLKKIEREINRLIFKLKNTVNTTIFNAVIYKPNIMTKSCSKAVKKRYDQKISKLRRKHDCSFTNDVSKQARSTVHNFFYSYSLTREKQIIWNRITHSNKTNKNLIYTEFEHFYQNLLTNIKDLPEANLCRKKKKRK